MTKTGGLINRSDLAKYTVKERRPVQGKAMGLTLLSMALPSSGGAVIIQALNVLESKILMREGPTLVTIFTVSSRP